MTDDKGAVENPYFHDIICVSGCTACAWKKGFTAGRKAEREKNWKTVADLCVVNPHTKRPCINNVERKFWCPVCLCADFIRGGRDGE